VAYVYNLTRNFPKEEMYGLTTQIRRCAISVPSNIAEGCGRNHVKDSVQFFYIAKGSMYELETQLYLSFDQKYITEAELENSLQLLTDNKKILQGFIKYYQSL
jgi:four helix bundle protein